jgi:hypothetical protein
MAKAFKRYPVKEMMRCPLLRKDWVVRSIMFIQGMEGRELTYEQASEAYEKAKEKEKRSEENERKSSVS